MLGHIAIAALGGAAAQLETGEAVDSYFAGNEVEMSTASTNASLPFAPQEDTIWKSRDNWETVDYSYNCRIGANYTAGSLFFQVKDLQIKPTMHLLARVANPCFLLNGSAGSVFTYQSTMPKNIKLMVAVSEKKAVWQMGTYVGSTTFQNGNFYPSTLPTDVTPDPNSRTIRIWQAKSFFLSSAWWRLAKKERFAFFLQPMKSLSGERAIFAEHNKSLIELI